MNKIKLLCLLFFLTSAAFGQTITVTGVVSDGETVLPGATVVVKRTKSNDALVGTITDVNGKYSLTVDRDAVLLISFIGFVSQEVPVGGRPIVNVVLETESTELEDVVVVGYGTQKKASAIASIVQTTGEDALKTGNVSSVTEAIQGALPGVTAQVTNGKPGDASALNIMIRGVATWTDTDPLVLVDGIERDMDDVDFNEIDKISVLKDASATAVFGVKGANGVILITTKRGIVSDKPEINFSANFGIKTVMTTCNILK